MCMSASRLWYTRAAVAPYRPHITKRAASGVQFFTRGESDTKRQARVDAVMSYVTINIYPASHYCEPRANALILNFPCQLKPIPCGPLVSCALIDCGPWTHCRLAGNFWISSTRKQYQLPSMAYRRQSLKAQYVGVTFFLSGVFVKGWGKETSCPPPSKDSAWKKNNFIVGKILSKQKYIISG